MPPINLRGRGHRDTLAALPEGVYPATVVSATLTTSSTGHQMLALEMLVSDADKQAAIDRYNRLSQIGVVRVSARYDGFKATSV